MPGAGGGVGAGSSEVQPTASMADTAIRAAATVRTASVLVLLFVLIGGAFHGLVRKRGPATASLADAIAGSTRGTETAR